MKFFCPILLAVVFLHVESSKLENEPCGFNNPRCGTKENLVCEASSGTCVCPESARYWSYADGKCMDKKKQGAPCETGFRRGAFFDECDETSNFRCICAGHTTPSGCTEFFKCGCSINDGLRLSKSQTKCAKVSGASCASDKECAGEDCRMIKGREQCFDNPPQKIFYDDDYGDSGNEDNVRGKPPAQNAHPNQHNSDGSLSKEWAEFFNKISSEAHVSDSDGSKNSDKARHRASIEEIRDNQENIRRDSGRTEVQAEDNPKGNSRITPGRRGQSGSGMNIQNNKNRFEANTGTGNQQDTSSPIQDSIVWSNTRINAAQRSKPNLGYAGNSNADQVNLNPDSETEQNFKTNTRTGGGPFETNINSASTTGLRSQKNFNTNSGAGAGYDRFDPNLRVNTGNSGSYPETSQDSNVVRGGIHSDRNSNINSNSADGQGRQNGKQNVVGQVNDDHFNPANKPKYLDDSVAQILGIRPKFGIGLIAGQSSSGTPENSNKIGNSKTDIINKLELEDAIAHAKEQEMHRKTGGTVVHPESGEIAYAGVDPGKDSDDSDENDQKIWHDKKIKKPKKAKAGTRHNGAVNGNIISGSSGEYTIAGTKNGRTRNQGLSDNLAGYSATDSDHNINSGSSGEHTIAGTKNGRTRNQGLSDNLAGYSATDSDRNTNPGSSGEHTIAGTKNGRTRNQGLSDYVAGNTATDADHNNINSGSSGEHPIAGSKNGRTRNQGLSDNVAGNSASDTDRHINSGSSGENIKFRAQNGIYGGRGMYGYSDNVGSKQSGDSEASSSGNSGSYAKTKARVEDYSNFPEGDENQRITEDGHAIHDIIGSDSNSGRRPKPGNSNQKGSGISPSGVNDRRSDGTISTNTIGANTNPNRILNEPSTSKSGTSNVKTNAGVGQNSNTDLKSHELYDDGSAVPFKSSMGNPARTNAGDRSNSAAPSSREFNGKGADPNPSAVKGGISTFGSNKENPAKPNSPGNAAATKPSLYHHIDRISQLRSNHDRAHGKGSKFKMDDYSEFDTESHDAHTRPINDNTKISGGSGARTDTQGKSGPGWINSNSGGKNIKTPNVPISPANFENVYEEDYDAVESGWHDVRPSKPKPPTTKKGSSLNKTVALANNNSSLGTGRLLTLASSNKTAQNKTEVGGQKTDRKGIQQSRSMSNVLQPIAGNKTKQKGGLETRSGQASGGKDFVNGNGDPTQDPPERGDIASHGLRTLEYLSKVIICVVGIVLLVVQSV